MTKQHDQTKHTGLRRVSFWRVMCISLAVCGSMAAQAQYSAVPFSDTFSYYDATALEGLNGWHIYDGSGTYGVLPAENHGWLSRTGGTAVANSDQAVVSGVTLENWFGNYTGKPGIAGAYDKEPVLTLDFDANPLAGNISLADLTASSKFTTPSTRSARWYHESRTAYHTILTSVRWFVKTNGLISAYNGHRIKHLTHTPITGMTHFKLECDYTNRVWSLTVGSERVVDGFALYKPYYDTDMLHVGWAKDYDGFKRMRFINSANDGSSLVDNVSVIPLILPAPPFQSPATGSVAFVSAAQLSANSDFDLSVYPGKASYNGLASGTFGDGTVEAYAFAKNTGVGQIGFYATGGSDISIDSYSAASIYGDFDQADVWTTSDPDVAPADYGGTNATLSGGYRVRGTIDISAYTNGTVYVLLGGYGDPFGLSLTMNGSGQSPIVVAMPQIDPPVNRNIYVASFAFSNAERAFSSLTYSYTGSSSTRAAFLGVVVDATEGPQVDIRPPVTAPAYIIDHRDGRPLEANTPLTYTVLFSEDIDEATVTAEDFSNAGTSGLTIGGITETSPGIFTVVVTPTNNGTLRLQINAGAVITDLASNALDTTSAILDDTTLTVEPANNVPVWLSNPVVKADATSGTAYYGSLSAHAEDGDADALTFTASASWLSVALNGALSGMPSQDDVGTNSITISVTDGRSQPVEATLLINVNSAYPSSPGIAFASAPLLSSGTDFDVSVYPGKAGFAGLVSGAFGDETVEAYAFARNSSSSQMVFYATGGSGITLDSYNAVSTFSEFDRADVWTIGDPAADPADYGGTNATISGGYQVRGTISITNYQYGTVYVLLGGYDTPFNLSLTMNGAGQPPIVESMPQIDPPVNRNMYVASFGFNNNGFGYQTITYAYTGSADNRSRFMGVVLDANLQPPPDFTPPTLVSTNIVDDRSGGQLLEGMLVTYTVSFSEDINEATLTTTDFGNAGTAGISIGSITETAPGVFTVEVTPTSTGSLRLQINEGATITDLSDNVLNTGVPIMDDTTLTVLPVGSDITPPILLGTDIVDDQFGAPVLAGTLVTYTVTFNEDIHAATVTAADFGNAGTAALSLGSITETAPGVFTVGATPTTGGSLRLQVNAGALISDTSGNVLGTTSAIVDDTTLTVAGIPVATFVPATISVPENGGVVTGSVVLSHACIVDVAIGHAFIGGTGDASDILYTPGTLFFAPGETNKTFSFTIADDTLDEGDETLLFGFSSLSNVTAGVDNTVTCTVQADVMDVLPHVIFSPSAAAGSESQAMVSVTVLLSKAYSGVTTVEHLLAPSGATATQDVDFVYASDTLTFAPGVTNQNFTFSVINDTLQESDETVVFTFGTISNGVAGAADTFTYTILSDLADIPPTVTFSPTAAVGPESEPTVTMTVKLSHVYSSTTTVEHVLFEPGTTATQGADFTYSSGWLTFLPGETNKTASFSVVNDSEDEGDETVAFTFGTITNGVAGANQTFIRTILADSADWSILPFYETFEDRMIGSLNKQHGWFATDVVVQDAISRKGDKAASVTNSAGLMKHVFTDARTNVWTDTRLQVVYSSRPPKVMAGDTVLCYVSTNGMVMAFDGQTPVATGVTLAEGTWARFTMHSDYTTDTWRLFVNGVPTGPYAFVAPASGYSECWIQGGDGTYVDDLAITLAQPELLRGATLIIVR